MSEIQNIVKQFQDAWKVILEVTTSLGVVETNLNTQREEQDKVQETLNKWNNKLTEREVAAAKIESVVNLNNENKALVNSMNQEREKLARETQMYNEHIIKENSALDEKRLLLSQDEETLKTGQEQLKIDTEEVKKERAEFKKNVIEKIAENIT